MIDSKKSSGTQHPIKSYEHKGKQRVNNPPIGLVTPDTDSDAGAKKAHVGLVNRAPPQV